MKLVYVILSLLLYTGCTRAGGDYSSMADLICGHEEETRHYVLKFLQECYSDAYSILHRDSWDICPDRRNLDCRGIHRLLRVTPSCPYCDDRPTLLERQACYNKQLEQSTCAVNNHLLPSLQKRCTCKRVRGKCVGTTDRLSTASPTYGTVPPKKAPECHCEPCGQKGGVSVGGAIGLMILGILLGVVGTTAVCVFVPKIYRKTSGFIFRRKVSKAGTLNGGPRQAPSAPGGPRQAPSAPPESHDRHVSDHTSAGGSYTLPSNLGSVQMRQQTGNEYHSLHGRRTDIDSHNYMGLQPQSTHFLPPGVYLEFNSDNDQYSDQAAPGANPSGPIESPTYQELNSDRGNPDYDQTLGVVADDIPDESSHKYFVLEPQARDTQDSDVSSHQYFVLEAQDADNSQAEKKDHR